jgi:hypothetical protein
MFPAGSRTLRFAKWMPPARRRNPQLRAQAGHARCIPPADVRGRDPDAAPLQVDVAHGPSPHDADAYYLNRRYRDLAERETSHDAFHGSPEWHDVPRAAILAMIDAYTSIVLPLDDEGIAALRRATR